MVPPPIIKEAAEKHDDQVRECLSRLLSGVGPDCACPCFSRGLPGDGNWDAMLPQIQVALPTIQGGLLCVYHELVKPEIHVRQGAGHPLASP